MEYYLLLELKVNIFTLKNTTQASYFQITHFHIIQYKKDIWDYFQRVLYTNKTYF